MSDDGTGMVRVEATGETVGEAKWAALKQLEQLVPNLDRESVEFQVVTEGERGLLGVGYTPAHVVASAAAGARGDDPLAEPGAGGAAREFVERVAQVIGASVTTTVSSPAESASFGGVRLERLGGAAGLGISRRVTMPCPVVQRFVVSQ